MTLAQHANCGMEDLRAHNVRTATEICNWRHKAQQHHKEASTTNHLQSKALSCVLTLASEGCDLKCLYTPLPIRLLCMNYGGGKLVA